MLANALSIVDYRKKARRRRFIISGSRGPTGPFPAALQLVRRGRRSRGRGTIRPCRSAVVRWAAGFGHPGDAVLAGKRPFPPEVAIARAAQGGEHLGLLGERHME
jgi:hypothetical protein